MSLADLIHELLSEDERWIPFLIFAGITIGGVSSMIGKTIAATSRERTKREIAAYIAEGSMSPEQGERLLRVNDRRNA